MGKHNPAQTIASSRNDWLGHYSCIPPTTQEIQPGVHRYRRVADDTIIGDDIQATKAEELEAKFGKTIDKAGALKDKAKKLDKANSVFEKA